jgi:hypothetical protein
MDYKALYEQSQKENETLKENLEKAVETIEFSGRSLEKLIQENDQLKEALDSECKQHGEEMDCSYELLDENKRLKEEEKEVKEVIAMTIQNSDDLTISQGVEVIVSYLEVSRRENEKLKKDRKICLQRFVGDTQVFIDLLEKYNLTEEKDLLASLKSRFVCDYCANGGCGIRPDGVECKDCYQTMKDTE